MRKIKIALALLLMACGIKAQTEENSATVEYLKPIEISKEKQNDYTGEYAITGNSDFKIKVEITDAGMAIVIPDIEKSKGEYELNNQYSMVAQYEDKFYLKKDAFIKIHFTRSKKTDKIISLLFNANRDKSMEVIRAVKVEK